MWTPVSKKVACAAIRIVESGSRVGSPSEEPGRASGQASGPGARRPPSTENSFHARPVAVRQDAIPGSQPEVRHYSVPEARADGGTRPGPREGWVSDLATEMRTPRGRRANCNKSGRTRSPGRRTRAVPRRAVTSGLRGGLKGWWVFVKFRGIATPRCRRWCPGSCEF